VNDRLKLLTYRYLDDTKPATPKRQDEPLHALVKPALTRAPPAMPRAAE
jgi:hypothetical protein